MDTERTKTAPAGRDGSEGFAVVVMTEAKRGQGLTVHLGDPYDAMPIPVPEPGCDVCAVLDRDRTAASAAGNLSAVSDCNVEMRAHLNREVTR